MEITVNQAIAAHQKSKLKEAEKLYRSILEHQPTNLIVNNNLGVLLYSLGRPDEAEASYRKAIEIKADYAQAHNNLGIVLQDLGRPDEAEASYRKAIEIKADYAEAYNNLGVVLQDLGRPDEAEASYRKAIEIKADYAEAYNNLGNILKNQNKFDEAEASYRKAIEIKPDFAEAHNNLSILPKEKELIINISEERKLITKNKINNIESGIVLSSNPFITHRNVETKLLNDLYNVKLKELDKTDKKDARYGNGKCTDFTFFKNDFLIVKKIEADLINIMKQAVKSNIYIFDSFLNIYKAGSGTTPHHHINFFDKARGLVNQKYSLTYYLSVGDQNCNEPGNLKLYDPSEEIKLSEGMVVIIPAYRKHCATYNGEKDRIMIGINFYSLL